MTATQKTEINKIAKLLVKKQSTIAVAESVTSGYLQALFSAAKDATAFFQGGMTVYNIGQKCRHLLVEPTHAIQCNCVSSKVADQMALSICNLFSSNYGIGITGYASPVPEQNVNELFCHISIAHRGKIVLSKKVFSKKMSPQAVQEAYCTDAIRLLLEVINER